MENESIEFNEGKSGSKKLIKIIIVLLILLGAVSAFIKFDIGNIGSKYAYPILKNIPVVNKILPDVVEETTSEETDENYSFENIDEAVVRLKATETLLNEKEVENENLLQQIQLLEDENSRLKVFEENQVNFDKAKEEFDNMVVFGEGTPDISNYTTFYEQIKPENAASIYAEAVKLEQYDEEILDIAASYEQMTAANAAAILTKMTTTSSKMKMVVQILNNINSEQRGAILGAMETRTAAKITEYMFPNN